MKEAVGRGETAVLTQKTGSKNSPNEGRSQQPPEEKLLHDAMKLSTAAHCFITA